METDVEGRLPSWAAHPAFDSVRLPLGRTLRHKHPSDPEILNQVLATLDAKPLTSSGRPIRFVAPTPQDGNYELAVFQTGCIATRKDNWHDFFNALAWMAFPRAKAALNALHADAIPKEGGRRGRLRDLLTLFDEGGAIVCADAPVLGELEGLVREARWPELFWSRRERLLAQVRVLVFGHAVLDMARAPWPGIACKVLFMPVEPLADQADARVAQWLLEHAPSTTPREVPAMPIFGCPGWHPGGDSLDFYRDTRYFRPHRGANRKRSEGKIPPRESARQPL